MSPHHSFGELIAELRGRKAGLSQNRLAELAGYAPAILVRMCQGKKDLTGPSGRERVVRIVGTLCDEGVRLTLDEANTLLASANLPPLYAGLPNEASLIRRLQGVAGSNTTVAVQRTNLLAALTSFVGREREVEELKERLTMARLVTLTGAGGVGKTRLALEVAARVAGAIDSPPFDRQADASTLHNFRDGVWLVELASLTDPTSIARTVAQVLGLPAGHDGSALGALQHHLQSKHLLLVLDNCEHILHACAELVEETLRRCLNVRVLATSREALRVPGEVVWQVPSLTIPATHLPPLRLLECEAAQLFVERASASQRAFKLSQNNAASVALICQRLEGIPLALELAAALTQGMTVEEIAARLNRHLPLLTEGYRRAVPRQQTMRGAMDWSYALLTSAQGRLLAHLSVFVGGWAAEAAEAMFSDERTDVVPMLLQLVRKSLVVAEPREAGTRYRLLEPIRQYAAEKLKEMGEEAAARDRHLACFVAFAEQADAGMMGYETGVWIKRVIDDFENLRIARAWSQTGAHDCESELRLAASLWRFWLLHAQLRDGETWIGQALEECSSSTKTTQARALYGLAVIYRYLRDYKRMALSAEKSLALCHELNDRSGAAHCLLLLAVHAKIEFDYAREVVLRTESMSIFRETGDTFGIGCALLDGAWTAMDRGDYEQATELLDELLELSRKLKELNGIWTGLWELAFVAQCCNDRERTISLLEQALPVAHEMGISEYTARAIELWALVDRLYATALGEVELNSRRELGDSLGIANMLLALGRTRLDSGDLEDAESLLTECVTLWDQLGPAGSEWGGGAWACLELGHMARLRGDIGHATAQYVDSLHQHEKARSMDGVAAAYLHLGHTALAQDDVSNAARWFKQSLSHYRDVGMRSGVAVALAGLAEVTRLQGDTQHAARLSGAAVALLRNEVLTTMRPIERADFERIISAARAQSNDGACITAWAEGHAMTIQQAITLGLADMTRPEFRIPLNERKSSLR